MTTPMTTGAASAKSTSPRLMYSTALAAAVAPSMYVLVVVATRIGMCISTFIVGTLMIPPPTPSRPDNAPAKSDTNIPVPTRRAR